MKLARTVADVLKKHVTLKVRSIDRMYLNLYVPILQQPAGIAHFWRKHRGYTFASTALMAPMTRDFVSRIEAFAEDEGIELVRFTKGQRKEDVAKDYLAEFTANEGVLFIGKAQEKVKVVRTQARRDEETGQRYPWLYDSTAMVNQYYFYCFDDDFGPFFLKLCSYFPYNGKLCLNGHEYLKRQLAKRGIAFEADDNCIVSCEDPKAMQRIADRLSANKIDRLARKWFKLLPHPFPAKDRKAGYRYDISVWQAEFATTHIVDRPINVRAFYEQAIRDNIDLGRPEHVQVVFNRRITRRTPGRFRTRVITRGVEPSLHIDYKHSGIKSYFKGGEGGNGGHGPRIETTINDTYDFGIGRRLHNLPALWKVGFSANQRFLSALRTSHDCTIGEEAFNQIHRPVKVDDQRASALRLDDHRARALFATIIALLFNPAGFFRSDSLRAHMAQLLGLDPSQYTRGMTSYDLRRLRLHGLIERIPNSYRYAITPLGSRVAMFVVRGYNRLFRRGYAELAGRDPPELAPLREAVDHLDDVIARLWNDAA